MSGRKRGPDDNTLARLLAEAGEIEDADDVIGYWGSDQYHERKLRLSLEADRFGRASAVITRRNT